jgi:glycosyltransferase involved in cell wall biosynthesis
MIIGMISTRFSGLDGVSLEAAKVAQALEADGHRFVWFGGELGPGIEPGMEYPAAHFAGEDNRRLQAAAMGWSAPMADLEVVIEAHRTDLRDALLDFIATFSLDALMIQNASAIPMQLALGLAIADVIEESGLPSIAHHHDFAWERERFDGCAVPEILEAAFPPLLPNLAQVVINQDARDELRRRRGVEATVLPNVMDFATPPPQVSGDSFRAAAGLTDRDVVLLQPTRVIPRKGIELTLQLAEQLADPNIKVVVSHSDDLDSDYWDRLQAEAARRRVDLRLASAGPDPEDLAAAYAAADLVCFPSLYEGFGNALLEGFYYRRPVFVNRYPVYRRDIAPTGVACIEIDGAVVGEAVEKAAHWLAGSPEADEAVERNYEVGLRHFSYATVRERIGPLLPTPV